MKTQLQNRDGNALAARVASEDLRRGDFVAVLSQIVELPSFLWTDALPVGQEELVRLRRLPTAARAPLKIEAICLPFLFVKQPNGQFETLDVRLISLARLEEDYARTVWKSLKKRPAKRRSLRA